MGAENSTAFIFLGPELGKKQDAVNAVKKKYSRQNTEESVFYAGEDNINIIADTLQNNCLFADARIVIVKNADLIKKKNEIDTLVSCIKNMEQDAVLILISDEIKLAAGLENAVPPANRRVFYEMFEKEKKEWLIDFFNREGLKTDKEAVTVILELVENNTAALKQECLRLVSFIKSNQKKGSSDFFLTAEDVEKWFIHNREESAFTLFSRIASQDKTQSLSSVAVMLAAKQSAQGILAGLAWCFRKLQDYIALKEKGYANNFLELKKIGLSSPKAKDDYESASKVYSKDNIQACLALTAEYDLLLRSPVSVMEGILMTRYILKLFNYQSHCNR